MAQTAHQPLWTRAAVIGACLVALSLGLSQAERNQRRRVARGVVPLIGQLAGYRLGVNTVEQMEARLGRGRVAVGGHPGSARQ